jgi:hypothetical protein
LINENKPEDKKITKDDEEKERIRQVRLARLGQSTTVSPNSENTQSPIKEAIVEKVEKAKEENKGKDKLDRQIAERRAEEVKREEDQRRAQDIRKANEAKQAKELVEKKQIEVEIQQEKVETNKDPKISKIISDSFNLTLSKGMIGKSFMQDLSVEKTMNGQNLFFEADDMATVIFFSIKNLKNENKFRHLFQCYMRAKSHVLSKGIEIDEILNYICSYFAILFTSPEAMDIEPIEVKQQIKNSAGMSMPPDMGIDPNSAMMQQLFAMMQQKNEIQEECFTNIQNEFYQAVVQEGIMLSNREFMEKVLEECKDEAFDLIVRKSFFELDDLTTLKTLNKVNSILAVISR